MGQKKVSKRKYVNSKLKEKNETKKDVSHNAKVLFIILLISVYSLVYFFYLSNSIILI